MRLGVRFVVAMSLCVAFGCSSDRTVPPREKSQAVPAPTKTPSVDVGVESFCPEICRRTHALQCRGAVQCDAMCRGAFADLACPGLLKRAMECALDQPMMAWVCSPDGFAAVMDGPCDREQEAYDLCLTSIK